jgi:L,D-transpeptidase catalytic domain
MYRILPVALLVLATIDGARAQGRSRETWGGWEEQRSYRDDRYERRGGSDRNWRREPAWSWQSERYDERWGWDRADRDRLWREERVPDARWQRQWSAPGEREDRFEAYSDRRLNWDEPRGQKVMDGGGQPHIAPIAPQRIAFNSTYEPGTIVIDTQSRQLLLVQSGGTALRYPISVGRQGFSWTGTEKISRIADWPDWHPPVEMRQREPHLPEKMTGGMRNPLGAKALYLGNTLYRIHGTNDARSIGQASSSGCFRMLNGHVIDLAGRVDVGTPVAVVSRLPRTAAMPR